MKKAGNLKRWITLGLIILIAAGSLTYYFQSRSDFGKSAPAGWNAAGPDGWTTGITLSSAGLSNAAEPASGAAANSVVSIVQSTKANAKDIQYEEIKTMVWKAVELAGGLQNLVKDGFTVVIKPNLVSMRDYTLPNWGGRMLDPEGNGTTTDWRITKAVVELVRKYDPSGKVYVMEGSSTNTRQVMQHLKYTKQYIPGVDEFLAIEEDSGAWHDYGSNGVVKVDLPNGLLHKEYFLNRKYKEADVVISLPCLKDHWDAAVTGAVKNVGIGATPGNLYGIDPRNPGRNNMVDHSSIDLHKWIHDFFLARPVDFAIMDGLQGIQNGPTPCYEVSRTDDLKKDQMNMRMILASRDSVALDTIEALVMEWDPQSVKYLDYLSKSAAGNLDTSRITVAGKQVDEVRKNFAGVTPSAGGQKITDLAAPKTKVKAYGVKNGMLSLSLETDKETVKAEIYVDGKLKAVRTARDLKNISLNIADTGKGKHEVKIWTFDRFLNRTENTIRVGNNIAGTGNSTASGKDSAEKAS